MIFIAGAAILIMINSKENLIFFLTPTELINSYDKINNQVRIGGFVKNNSLKANTKKNLYSFVITDNLNDIEVEYKGILPDLFKEGQGAVIEGTLANKKKISASKVFAKHDENYMPSSIKKQLKKSDYWKKDYYSNDILDKNLPNFEIINLFDESIKLSNIDINNQQVIINFFASWCAPCKDELPLFFILKNNQPNIMIIGISYKDKKSDALKFLGEEGNPYHFVGLDNNGNIGLEFGVFGLPETFLTNTEGEIIYKHLGPLTKKVVQNEILPLLQ
jgi:cytochrome c biogenesis protein CcmG/thiol:disulfide interchange protein DsbE